MQQHSDAARDALDALAHGKMVQPARFGALVRAGLVAQSDRGKRARWWLTDAGRQFLRESRP